jgi:hypothetical protein
MGGDLPVAACEGKRAGKLLARGGGGVGRHQEEAVKRCRRAFIGRHAVANEP